MIPTKNQVTVLLNGNQSPCSKKVRKQPICLVDSKNIYTFANNNHIELIWQQNLSQFHGRIFLWKKGREEWL